MEAIQFEILGLETTAYLQNTSQLKSYVVVPHVPITTVVFSFQNKGS